MKRIIDFCLQDVRGYTPATILSLLEETIEEPHVLFEVKGAYLWIGIHQKTTRYEKLESFNGSFENLAILKTIGSFYRLTLEDDIEPYLSDFINELQTIDFTKLPIHLV